MKIGVLVKNVPDTETKIKLNADQTDIEAQGIKYVMNPYDEYAVEQALLIREELKDDTTVTVFGLGADRVVETLRTALAMGADEAVHVSDPAFEGGDSLANARVLAKVVEPMGFDIIFGGKQGIDFDSSQTCAALAEALGMQQAMVISSFELADDKTVAQVRRRVEGGEEIIDVKLPAVISCDKGLNEPRYASLPGIMKAKKKEIKKVALADTGLQADEVGAAGSASRIAGYAALEERPACRMLEGEPADIAAELTRALREDSKVI